MQTQTIAFDKDEAREMWRKYRSHQHYSTPVDQEIATIYQRIAQGRTVIRALASIIAAGVYADGPYRGLPKLAIARADQREVDWRPDSNGGRFRSGDGRSNAARGKVIQIERGTWPGMGFQQPWGTARLPTIPLPIRPKRGLANYHVLWEAEWKPVPPGDPFLLRRIGQSDAWLVVGAWDLTEVERAVLSTRLNG